VPERKTITTKDLLEKAKSELTSLTGFPASSVISFKKESSSTQGAGDIWKVVVEMLEKQGIPDRTDILGVYEIQFDARGELISYERIKLRKRGDTEEPAEIAE
jgi:hypothetical protein